MAGDLFIFMLFAVISTQIMVIYRLLKYKNMVDEKNIQLVRCYLDMKFINKNISSNSATVNPDDFCIRFIDEIKEYYNFQDILVINSLDDQTTGDDSTEDKIINYIKSNLVKIEDDLKNSNITRLNMQNQDTEYTLHIANIKPGLAVKDGVIVCIHKIPSLLDKHEMLCLENCINLLKNRIKDSSLLSG